jgi:hypothetical protein
MKSDVPTEVEDVNVGLLGCHATWTFRSIPTSALWKETGIVSSSQNFLFYFNCVKKDGLTPQWRTDSPNVFFATLIFAVASRDFFTSYITCTCLTVHNIALLYTWYWQHVAIYIPALCSITTLNCPSLDPNLRGEYVRVDSPKISAHPKPSGHHKIIGLYLKTFEWRNPINSEPLLLEMH